MLVAADNTRIGILICQTAGGCHVDTVPINSADRGIAIGGTWSNYLHLENEMLPLVQSAWYVFGTQFTFVTIYEVLAQQIG